MESSLIKEQDLDGGNLAKQSTLEEVQSVVNTINTTVASGNAEILSKVASVTSAEHGVIKYDVAGTYEWVCPKGISEIVVLVGGAGGGGAGGTGNGVFYYTYHSSGGGAGGVACATINVKPNQKYTIIVGEGGVGGKGGKGGAVQSASNNTLTELPTKGGNGKNGGESSFDDIVTVTGGLGGRPSYFTNTLQVGGTVTGMRQGAEGSGGSFGFNDHEKCIRFYGCNGISSVASGNGNSATVGATAGGYGVDTNTSPEWIYSGHWRFFGGAGGSSGITGAGYNASADLSRDGTDGSNGADGSVIIIY